eukprot:Tamp_05950.p1 GENE.Tamp_05950~~Tamp_05950.p1  ORF type:complete len:796 (+),score=175.80 Tamp_05950:290-2389(+)
MVMGLGAGTLAGWLLQTLPSLTELSCSELDPQVRDIATSYFGLDDQDPRLTLQVGDALEHAAAAQAAGKTFDLVVVDVGGAQDVESPAMMAPPVAFQTREALRLAADLVAPGGVLSMTVVGGGDQELLQLLEHLEHALEETSGPGGHVCYLESRAAERWLRSSSASVPSRIIYALKHVAPSANGVRDAPPRGFLRARASVFDAELGAVSGPAAAAAGFGIMSSMLQRVQVELNDVQGLRRRIQQTAVFASLSPSLASPSAPPPAAPTPGSAGTGWYKEKQRAEGGTGSSDAASSAYEAQLRVFRQNQPLQAGPPDQAAQGRWESAKQQQKWVYAQNNPGVADLDALRAAPPPQEKTEDRDRQEKTQDRGQPATTHDARSRQLLDPDEELQVSAEDEAALLEELTEFRRRQSSGEAGAEATLEILRSSGVLPATPPALSKAEAQPGEAQPAAAPTRPPAQTPVAQPQPAARDVPPRRSSTKAASRAAVPSQGDLVRVLSKTASISRKALQHKLEGDLYGVVAAVWAGTEEGDSMGQRGLTAYFYPSSSRGVAAEGADAGPPLFKHDFLLEEVEVVEQRQRGEQGEGATASQVPTAASGPGPKPAAEARTDASGRGRPASRPASGAKRATVKCSLVLVSSQSASIEVVGQVVAEEYAQVLFQAHGSGVSCDLQGEWDDIFAALASARARLPDAVLSLTILP